MSTQILVRYDHADYATFRAAFDADAEDRGHAGLNLLQLWREGANTSWALFDGGTRARAYLDGNAQVFNSRAGVTAASAHVLETA